MTSIALYIVTCAVLGLSFYGIGRSLASLFAVDLEDDLSPVLCLWLGWCTTIFYLLSVHFFLPIQVYEVLPLLAFGVVKTGLFWRSSLHSDRSKFGPREGAGLLLLAVLLLGMGIWLSLR